MKFLSLALLAATLCAACSSLMKDHSPAGVCGDGVKDEGEECDRAPIDGLACSATCRLERCGNGIKDPGEECDQGEANDNAGDCTRQCRLARCGDGFLKTHGSTSPDAGVDPTLERCDDGNTVNGDGCNPQCQMLGRVTVIGGQPGGMGIADGVGSSARLANVSGLVAAGYRLFFSESDSCLIRMLYLPTGQVRTVAGIAKQCQVKDGPAEKATFSRTAMPMARVGSDLYLGQGGLVRKLALDDPQQTVSTCLSQPDSRFVAVAADPQQSDVLYVAEPRALYKMSLPCDCTSAPSARNCGLQLVAGDKKAPSQAVDGSGSTARFVAIQSLAVNSRDNLLYVGDGASIRALDLAAGSIFTMAGSANSPGHDDGAPKTALLGLVRGLALVGDGLYFSEQSLEDSESSVTGASSLAWGNLRRLGLLTSSEIETVAGTFGPVSSLDAGETDGFSSFARFVDPGPLALVGSDSDGVLAIGEPASLRIYDLRSRQVTAASGVLEKDFSYRRISTVAAKDGDVYVVNGLYQILRVPVAHSRPVALLANCPGNAHLPVALTIFGSTLFVADAGLGGVCAIDLSSTPQAPRMVLSGIDLASWAVTGMVADEQALTFACRADGTIRRADLGTGKVSTMEIAHSLSNPWALARVDGDLVVTIPEQNLILRIDGKTGAARPIGTGLDQTLDSNPDDPNTPSLCHPTGLAWDPATRQLFVAETHCASENGVQGHAIRQIDWDSGAVTTLLGPGPRLYLQEGTGGLASVNGVGALTFDNETQALYAADTWENALLKIE